METVVINRLDSNDEGTPGVMACARVNFSCRVMELPWRDNKVGYSYIPAGTYIVKPYTSQKFGKVYYITGVPGRSAVLFHSGTWAGDVLKNYKTHSRGCILLCTRHGYVSNQRAGLLSKDALRRFREAIGDSPFKLIIQ